MHHRRLITVLGLFVAMLGLVTPALADINPVLVEAGSRRSHGSASFDVALPLTGNTGIECRRTGGMAEQRPTNSDARMSATIQRRGWSRRIVLSFPSSEPGSSIGGMLIIAKRFAWPTESNGACRAFWGDFVGNSPTDTWTAIGLCWS